MMVSERMTGIHQYNIGNIALDLRSDEALCEVIAFPRSSHRFPSTPNVLKEIIDALRYGDCRGCDVKSEPKSARLYIYGSIALGFLSILGVIILPVLV